MAKKKEAAAPKKRTKTRAQKDADNANKRGRRKSKRATAAAKKGREKARAADPRGEAATRGKYEAKRGTSSGRKKAKGKAKEFKGYADRDAQFRPSKKK
tara:strand:+ start:17457 stop:17753 length:297 start_codon:yes stop_codon:yes gene_type:complete